MSIAFISAMQITTLSISKGALAGWVTDKFRALT
jgi:hypothetical protein